MRNQVAAHCSQISLGVLHSNKHKNKTSPDGYSISPYKDKGIAYIFNSIILFTIL